MNAAPSSSALPASKTPQKPRRWTITTTNGETISGHLPSWATDDPSEQDLSAAGLAVRLADIDRSTEFPGQVLHAYSPGNPTDEPAPRTPVVNVRVAGEDWLTDYGPGDLTTLAERPRTTGARP